jgi:hypothetical protein
MSPDHVLSALEALEDCTGALRELDAACCDPGRGRRMQALEETLEQARDGIHALREDAGATEATAAHLEAARDQVRALQAACCEPHRLPMYRLLLEGLTTARVAVHRPDGS